MSSSNKHLKVSDTININETTADHHSIQGHVTITDSETGKVLLDKDNLVLQRARVWLFEQLFKVAPSEEYINDGAIVNNNRQALVLSVGSGGSDLNASAFTTFVPVFSDKDLGQKVPFVLSNPDKDNDTRLNGNPSIVKELTDEQKAKYRFPQNRPDGSVEWYGKLPNGSNQEKPYGTSKGWNINKFTGEVSYTISYSINKDECRGSVINELGLYLSDYSGDNAELLTRITFQPEPLSNLSKSLDIDYTLYI